MSPISTTMQTTITRTTQPSLRAFSDQLERMTAIQRDFENFYHNLEASVMQNGDNDNVRNKVLLAESNFKKLEKGLNELLRMVEVLGGRFEEWRTMV
jgi:hypothetical protein